MAVTTTAGPVEWIGTREVAEMFGVPEATVRYWKHIGYGCAGIKLGRSVRYRRADWEAFAEQLLNQAVAGRTPAA